MSEYGQNGPSGRERAGYERAVPSRSGERRAAGSGAGSSEERSRQAPRRRTRKRPLIVTLIVRFFQLLGTLLLVGIVTGGFMLCFAGLYIKNVVMPKTALDLSVYTMPENSVLYYWDSEAEVYRELITLSGEMNSEEVALEDIPQDLIDAFVGVEDKRFWKHNGVDWFRTGGAVLNMFLSMRDNFGGSTITQQLIKNVTKYDDVTVTRKIQEIFTALELEKNYKKEEILEVYLNRIFMGSRCYGVQAAAQTYFGKDVSELSLAECASLAGITNNPSLYGPNSDLRVTRYKCKKCEKYTNSSTGEPDECSNSSCGAKGSFGAPEIWTARDYNKARQETILGLMLEGDPDEGIEPTITQAEYDQAIAEELHFVDYTGAAGDGDEEDQESNYSWFVETVISEAKRILAEQTGLDDRAVSQLLYSGGLHIYTTFDPKAQAAVDEVYGNMENIADKNGNTTSAKKGQTIKSAITVVDNSNGYVVAIAGDVGTKKGDLIYNYATMLHQPGSSFKPLSVYAPALEMGLVTPGTAIDDNPLSLNGKAWPRNDGKAWQGLMSLQSGLEQSLNTIAVRTLTMVTPEASFEFLRDRFGITSLVEGKDVRGDWKTDIALSPLALGSPTDGVSTYEMAAAFASFPRNGMYTRPTTVLKIEDRNRQPLIDNTPKDERAVKDSTAWYMNTMLTAAVRRGTGTPARLDGMTAAGKTGTTQDSYARWFSGYTPYYTASVWVGYQYNESIENYKRNPAVIMWQKVMTLLNEGKEDIGFPKPEGLATVSKRICLDCGLLADVGCENDSRGSRVQSFEYAAGDEPTETCICHVPVEICTESPIPDENGEETGFFHMAGEFCPEESRKTVYYVDYTRELTTDPWNIGDYEALKSTYDIYNGEMTCQVHTGEPVDPLLPPGFDPNDPSTWVSPSDDPNASDTPRPSDWPWWYSPPPTESFDVPTDVPTLPVESPDVDFPTLPPEPSPVETPEPDPFIPVGTDPDPDPAPAP